MSNVYFIYFQSFDVCKVSTKDLEFTSPFNLTAKKDCCVTGLIGYFDTDFNSLENKVSLTYLPPAYVVRREGNSFTLLVCPHLGGGAPISHNALQHFPECHGAAGGGYPARSSWGGTLPGGGYPAGGLPR